MVIGQTGTLYIYNNDWKKLAYPPYFLFVHSATKHGLNAPEIKSVVTILKIAASQARQKDHLSLSLPAN